ncbi:MAG: recombination mediator RecR [Methylococcales bacterium]
MTGSGLVHQLIQGLRCLPGVGPKSAQRMALYLLQKNRQGAKILAETLLDAIDRIGHCERCRTLTEDNRCSICSDTSRDSSILCIVESPADVIAVDQATVFRGVFFVLHGHLSPLDGIGPEELGMPQLQKLLESGGLDEVILATNTTVEGEATALYISEMARTVGVRVTRIAHGVPLGGELEYVDSGTLLHAFSGRKEI